MVNQKFSVSVHIMMALDVHRNDEVLMNSEILAQSIQTNSAVVRRIMTKLVEADLVKSFKGKSGGVRINRAADKINLKDIYLAVEEQPILNTHRPVKNKQCKVSCCIQDIMKNVVLGLEQNSMDYLEKIKLSHLTKNLK